MIEQTRPWLCVPWDSVVGLNRTLCQAQKMEALVNSKTIAASQERWEKAGQKSMNLLEALTVCREVRDSAPFTFNNGNTFAALARGLVEDSLRNTPSVEAQIIRTTISHYVAGTVGKKELQQVMAQLAPLLTKPGAAPRSSTELPTPRLTEARRLA